MQVRTEDLNQTATYWSPATNDGFGGLTYGDPVVIACRWQAQARHFTDTRGEQQVSQAVVYVDRQLELEGKILLGEFSGMPPKEAISVRQTGSSPDLDAEEELLKVWL